MSIRNVFFNGEFIKQEDNLLDLYTPGVFKAKGVFETLRVYDGNPFALDEHIVRLQKGADLLDVFYVYRKNDIAQWAKEVVLKNPNKNARMRIMLFQKQPRRTNLLIMVLPLKPFTQSVYKKGFNVSVQHMQSQATERQAFCKSLDYELYHRAYLHAQDHNYDEAILLNENDDIIESSRSNIFWIKANALFTPALGAGCLAGITREKIMSLAKSQGMQVNEVYAKVDDLIEADEIFLTNSVMEIMPVTAIESKAVGNFKTMTNQLSKAYKALING